MQGKRCFGTKEKLLTQQSSKKLVTGAGFDQRSRGRGIMNSLATGQPFDKIHRLLFVF